MTSRAALLRRASVIALVGNAILAMTKLVVGALAGSLAVVGDGIDSATDVVIAIVALIAARIVDKPGDREHPYGHSRAETIATSILAFVLFFAGTQLFIRTLGDLIGGTAQSLPSRSAIIVTFISIAGKLCLTWTQFHYGNKSGSPMLLANAKNMRGDVVVSVGVLVGLGFTFGLGLPLLDRVTALLVSLWIIKVAAGIFLETNSELMEGSSDHGPYGVIFEAVADVEGAVNPHRTRIRRLGSMLIVDLDIEVEPSMTVATAHSIALEVENEIKARLPEVYDVIVHVEPRGNLEEGERYGLRPSDDEPDQGRSG
ncbi:MAG TPA: cation diffusion facilitator family transporter [Rectinemataceae bacterium]|nr:cation diffusion facilitator family transporter [Rectinemataceae bacterium]